MNEHKSLKKGRRGTDTKILSKSIKTMKLHIIAAKITDNVMINQIFVYSCCSCAMSIVCWIIGGALIVILAVGLGVYFGIFHGDSDPVTDVETTNTLILKLNETIRASYISRT